jgi:hypothetical protein
MLEVIRVNQKACPEEETEGKRQFGSSFETSLKQALTLLPKATRARAKHPPCSYHGENPEIGNLSIFRF